MTHNSVDFALFYASKGWRVFPVGQKSKIPALKNWPEKSTVDPEQINKWFSNGSGYNVGIATGERSGIFALDVDSASGGNESLLNLIRENGALPQTVESMTGGGGHHILFNYPNFKISNSAGKLGPGLDIRAEGGCIVAPPSVHDKTGKNYEWEISSKPSQVPVSDAPNWLLKLLAEKQPEKELPTSDKMFMIVSGARNSTLASKAGAMRRKGFQADEIYAALVLHNQKFCSPPLPDDELRIISKSMTRYTPETTPVSGVDLFNKNGNGFVNNKPRANSALQGVQSFIEILGNLDGRSIPVFITPMDRKLGGLERQTLTILAARPSMGKTTLAWQIARNVAINGLRVLVLSMEASEISLWAKAACGALGLRWRDIRAGEYENYQMKDLLSKALELGQSYGDNLYICDGSVTTESSLQLIDEVRPDLIVADHVRLFGDVYPNEAQRLGIISKNCKEIAKHYNAAYLLCCQLNRNTETRGDKRPLLSDLRESGHLEENGDNILMMYREGYYNPDSGNDETEILVRKFRDDIKDQKIYLRFDADSQWFNDTQIYHSEPMLDYIHN